MTSDIYSLITQAAADSGVPPALALSVANVESGGNQYNSDGSLVTGSSGEIGVFQLMPATAAGIPGGPYDPNDVTENVDGGVAYLAQMYSQFGNWNAAIAAYNAGPSAVAAGRIPSSTTSYVSKVLAGAGMSSAAASTPSSAPTLASLFTSAGSGSAVPIGALLIGLFGLLVLSWVLD